MQYKHTVSQNIIGMTPPFFLDLGDGRSVMNRASRVSALRVTAAIAREWRISPHPAPSAVQLRWRGVSGWAWFVMSDGASSSGTGGTIWVVCLSDLHRGHKHF